MLRRLPFYGNLGKKEKPRQPKTLKNMGNKIDTYLQGTPRAFETGLSGMDNFPEVH